MRAASEAAARASPDESTVAATHAIARPVPDRVDVGNCPGYATGRKLGKGGKVYVGTRIPVLSGGSRKGRNAYQVALKFDHRRSKVGIYEAYDPPFEWEVYQTLKNCYGIPSVLYKGCQGNYYILVATRFDHRNSWHVDGHPKASIDFFVVTYGWAWPI